MWMCLQCSAGPIARALDLGAEIVITGRCVDSAIALGPLIHEFKWPLNDWDRLAQGSVAGHLIECGAQSTGGIFTDWHTVPHFENIGLHACTAHVYILIRLKFEFLLVQVQGW